MQHTQNTFKLSQDGEILVFSGDEAICYDDYKSQNDPTETFFDWCKNSYPFTQEDKELKCTPGELRIFAELNVETDKGEFICSCGVNGRPIEQGMANAARIVKAWNCHDDLYNALKECREWYEKKGFKLCEPDTPICFSKALSALAKASPSTNQK